MTKRQYTTKRSVSARKVVAAQLPGPCIRCKRIVTVDMKWEADHIVSRVTAESMGWTTADMDSPTNLGISHASCNHKAGAALGNKLKAKPRTEQRKIAPIKRKIEFSSEGSNTPASALHVFYPIASDGSQEAQDGS